MNKTIWIINEYAGSPYHGMSYRHYYLAREMAKQGAKPVIVSASYSHLLNKLPDQQEELIDGIQYRWLKVPRYSESQSKWRVLKWLVFSFKLLFLPFFRLPAPDYIIVSPTALFPVLPAFFLAKKFKAKLIFEVRDIWPLTLIEIGGYRPSHPFIRLMSWMERFALEKSDLIVSNLQNYGSHIRSLGIDRDFVWISNGIDLDEVTGAVPLDAEIDPEGKVYCRLYR